MAPGQGIALHTYAQSKCKWLQQTRCMYVFMYMGGPVCKCNGVQVCICRYDICAHVHLHLCIACVDIYMLKHVCQHVCVRACDGYVGMCMCICMCAHLSTYLFVCMWAYVQTCVIHAHVYSMLRMHMYTWCARTSVCVHEHTCNVCMHRCAHRCVCM